MNKLHHFNKRKRAAALVAMIALIAAAGCTTESIDRADIAPIQIITEQGLTNIDSVVLDRENRVYVTDVHSVKVFSFEGDLLFEIGRQGLGEGEFPNEVIGVAINSQEEIYAVDQDEPRVQVFDSKGIYLHGFGSRGDAPGQFGEPQGVVIDHLDLVYVSDKSRNDVQVFSREGEFLYRVAGGEEGRASLNEPESMAIHNERLYVADEGNRRIQIYGMRGGHLGSIPHAGIFGLNREMEASLDDMPPSYTDVEHTFKRYFESDIEGIAFDNQGLLYALDEDAGEVLVFRNESKVAAFKSTQPIKSGDGIAFDYAYQRLYVVDQGNNQVQVFDINEIYRLLEL